MGDGEMGRGFSDRRRNEDENDRDRYPKTRWQSDGTGGKVKSTLFSDGSSITHFGGPAGDLYSDEFGNT